MTGLAGLLAADGIAAAPWTFVAGLAHPVDLQLCPLHHHSAAEIVYHPSGRGETTLGDGTRIRFAPGDAVFYAPYVRHDQRMSEPGIDCWLQARCDQALPQELHTGFAVRGPLPAWLAAELTDLSRPQPESAPLARRALDHRTTAAVLALLALAEIPALQAPAAPGRRLADQAAAWISEHFRDVGRLEEVAEQFGTPYDTLRRAFRRHRGMSLVRWLTEVRLARAKELLTNTPLRQADIARQCGYASARYLATVFRQATGMTPEEWRRRT